MDVMRNFFIIQFSVCRKILPIQGGKHSQTSSKEASCDDSHFNLIERVELDLFVFIVLGKTSMLL